MKKLFVTAIISMACVFGASAQRASSSSTSFFSTEKADQGITWGIRGGLNLSNMKISDGSSSESADSKPGFNIGVSVDIPLLQSLYLQSGLYYTTKGYKHSEEYDREKDEVKVISQYLELPVMASYRYNFNETAQLQVNFGPYFAYGIGGKAKESYEYNGDKDEDKYDLFGKEGILNRFDAGLGIGAGITLSKFFIGINYQFGLANIAKDAPNDYSIKNKNFSINIGYNF